MQDRDGDSYAEARITGAVLCAALALVVAAWIVRDLITPPPR
jgi:hypothetical protein